MFVGFIVVGSGVIGYQFSSHSIEQSNLTKQLKEESKEIQARITASANSYERNRTAEEKRFDQCFLVRSVLLENARKNGSLAEISRSKSYLRDCGIFLR